MELKKSYVVTYSKNKELIAYGQMFIDAGYIIKTFSLNDTEYSNYYNPIKYVFDVNGKYSEEKASIVATSYIDVCLGKDAPYKDVIKKTLKEGIKYLSESKTVSKDLMGLLDVFKQWSETMESVSVISEVNNVVIQQPLKVLIRDLTDLLYKYDGRYILTDADESTVLHMLDVDIENLGYMKMSLFIDMDDSGVPVKKWINALLIRQCSDTLFDAKQSVKDKYCLVHDGEVLVGMFDTKKEASRYRAMFANAYFSSDTELTLWSDGMVRLMSEFGEVITYLISCSEGEKLISDYKESEIIRYDKDELPF